MVNYVKNQQPHLSGISDITPLGIRFEINFMKYHNLPILKNSSWNSFFVSMCLSYTNNLICNTLSLAYLQIESECYASSE